MNWLWFYVATWWYCRDLLINSISWKFPKIGITRSSNLNISAQDTLAAVISPWTWHLKYEFIFIKVTYNYLWMPSLKLLKVENHNLQPFIKVQKSIRYTWKKYVSTYNINIDLVSILLILLNFFDHCFKYLKNDIWLWHLQ